MAPLPPPPPPAPPPPPPMGGPVAEIPKLSKNESMDRNALLSQIRGGARLKKASNVMDRSSPLIDGKSPKSNPGVTSKPVSNGPGGPPMQLGGLFAAGVPKLRSTGSKLVANGLTVSANKVNNNCTKTDESVRLTNTSSIKTSLEEKLQINSNNQNNSSFLHSKISSNTSNGLKVNNNNKFYTMKAREKPSYVLSEGKGQAPQVPAQGYNRPNAPELPKKPPGVQRSNSQTSGRPGANAGRRPGPPNIKPPPPPKMTNGLNGPQSTQTSFSSKPSNVNQTGKLDISALVSNFNQQGVKPPAPPRNANQMSNGISQSPTYPPPPPPVSTIPARTNSSAQRLPQMKSIAPNIPIQAMKAPSGVRPPLGPPPPPPHRTTSNNTTNSDFPSAPPPPPSQTKVIPTALRNGVTSGPTPPVRNTSIGRDEFATRFATFKAIFELPAPTPMTATHKVYPSHMQQSQRRRDPPPPPPPQLNGLGHNSPNLNAHNSSAKKYTSNPVLHIQIGSTVAQS